MTVASRQSTKAFFPAMESALRKPRRRKPIPAALATTLDVVVEEGEVRTIRQPLIEQLCPTDDLRLRRVTSEPEVREALDMVSASHRQVVEALKRAASSPEAAAALRRTREGHEALVKEFLEPAILRAERRLKLSLAAAQPKAAELAAKVVERVDGDRLLAADTLVRRNPHWRDPAVWSAPECIRYLARSLGSEARFERFRRLRTCGSESRQPSAIIGRELAIPPEARFSPLSAEVPRRPGRRGAPMIDPLREEARQKRVERGLRVLRRLHAAATPDQRRVLDLMRSGRCGPFAACARLGLPRSTAVALCARAKRLRSRIRKTTSLGR
jgi:hypothetical protein